MRHLISIPILVLAVILQSAVFSRVTLLSGAADLPLVVLAAWALQEQVDTAWQWALAAGALVGFVSGMPIVVPLIAYLLVVLIAQALQRRVWQAPLLAMFVVTFVGTLLLHLLSLGTLRLLGIPLQIPDVLGLITLPAVLLNLLIAIPVFAVMRDLAVWVYPLPEVL
jgi:rod shape-determining protein MreD